MAKKSLSGSGQTRCPALPCRNIPLACVTSRPDKVPPGAWARPPSWWPFFPKRNFWVMKRRNQDEAETPRVFYDTNGPAHGEQKETENESRPATGC